MKKNILLKNLMMESIIKSKKMYLRIILELIISI